MKKSSERFKRHQPAIFFLAGFLFDALTLNRIDSWLKLTSQIIFLGLLGYLIWRLHKTAHRPIQGKLDQYQNRIIQFLFGNLLSAYVVFYFKSSTLSQSLVFISLLTALMVLNELPAFKKFGIRVRIVLFAFCTASFLIYFVPILVRKMETAVFIESLLLSLFICSWLTLALAKGEPNPLLAQRKLLLPAVLLHIVLASSYFLKLIPPVPLSLTYTGIYSKIEKIDGKYVLQARKPWYDFFSKGEGVFYSGNGIPVYCFVRIYAPTQFQHKIFLTWFWYDETLQRFTPQDRIPIQITGGREEGFRGTAYKSNYKPGNWKIEIETEDFRPLGILKFRILPGPAPSDWDLSKEEA